MSAQDTTVLRDRNGNYEADMTLQIADVKRSQVSQPANTPNQSTIGNPSHAAIAGPAKMRRRHHKIVFSFLLVVILPFILCAGYLWNFAKDQYVANISFSVRTENTQSAIDLLGGMSTMLGGSGVGNDPEIIKQFIASADLVTYIEQKEKVSEVFSAGWPQDFIFAYNPSGTIEDLHKYWQRNVYISIDDGLISLSVRSYDALRSRDIALSVFDVSQKLVNKLSQEAREDATRFSREDLLRAEDRLLKAREAMTQFRLQTKIVDPMATLQAEIGILSSLQAQLAEALVQKELLSKTSTEQDPRISDLNRKVDALRTQIEIERRKFAQDSENRDGQDYATLFSTFEHLSAEREFAEEAYRVATVAHDVALTDAKMNSRYLAMHVKPTVAQKSLFPDRPIQLLVVGIFLVLFWSLGLLIYYSIRDRR